MLRMSHQGLSSRSWGVFWQSQPHWLGTLAAWHQWNDKSAQCHQQWEIRPSYSKCTDICAKNQCRSLPELRSQPPPSHVTIRPCQCQVASPTALCLRNQWRYRPLKEAFQSLYLRESHSPLTTSPTLMDALHWQLIQCLSIPSPIPHSPIREDTNYLLHLFPAQLCCGLAQTFV